MPGFLSQQFQKYQAQRPQPAQQSFGTGNFRPLVGQGQAFPGFAQAPPNLSFLGGQSGPAVPRPQVPTAPNSTQVAGAYNPTNAYNRMYQQWLAQNQGPTQFQQGAQALMQDVANNNASQNLMFQQGQGLFNQTMGLVGQMDDRFVGTANQLGGMLEGQADKTSQMGQGALDGWQKMYDRNRGDLMGQIGASNQMADQSVMDFEAARDGYKDMAAQNVSAMLGGMANDIGTQMQQIQSGVGPGGEMLTPDQIQEQMAAMKSNWQQQRYGIATQLLNQQNETMATLQQAVGQARLGASQLRAGNAGTLGQFDTAGGGQYLQAHEQRLQAQDMSNNLYALSASMKNGAQMLSIDHQLNGMQFASQLARDFPYSPTSMFDVYLNLMGLEQAGAMKKNGYKNLGGMPQSQLQLA